MNEKIFFTTPLFPSSDLAGSVGPAPSTRATPKLHCRKLDTTRIQNLPMQYDTRCFNCSTSGVACYQRPVELGWYCASCIDKERLLESRFDPVIGFDVLTENRCLTCFQQFTSFHEFQSHCGSRSHQRLLAKLKRSSEKKHIRVNSNCPCVMALEKKLVNVLHSTETRFRRQLSKQTIETLPLMVLSHAWEATERRLMQCDRSRVDQTLSDWEEDTTTSVNRYRVVHVSPEMSKEDFETLLAELRTETIFGFDTETAPQAFFPHVHRVFPKGPHLFQLASTRHVWLISTTNAAGWDASLRLQKREAPSSAEKNRPEEIVCKEDAVAAVVVEETSKQTFTRHSDSVADESTLNEATQLLLGSPLEHLSGIVDTSSLSKHSTGEAIPLDGEDMFITNKQFVTRRILRKVSTVAHVNVIPLSKRIPQFLLDFLHRRDVALVGFGLDFDIIQLQEMLQKRYTSSAGDARQEPFEWHPPTLDLGTLFLTDLKTEDGAFAGVTKHQSSSHNQHVGTAQAAARVFTQRFSKPKQLSTSNWGCPSRLLSTKQLIYACRDAVFPLFLVQHLLQRFHQSSLIADRDSGANDSTSSRGPAVCSFTGESNTQK